MKTSILWIAGGLVLCFAGWLLLRTLKSKKSTAPAAEEQEPLSEQQQALALLRQHREEMAAACYRKECASLFSGISGGIQGVLAQERRSDVPDFMFCASVADAAEDESLGRRIANRKKYQPAKPLSPEEEAADPETIREIIRVEDAQAFSPAIQIPWDSLTDRLIPCLEALLEAAEAGCAQDCRSRLAQLRELLAQYSIYPVWYHDDAVQHNPSMAWDFIEEPALSMPTLYYHGHDKYVRVGIPGYTGSKKEKES